MALAYLAENQALVLLQCRTSAPSICTPTSPLPQVGVTSRLSGIRFQWKRSKGLILGIIALVFGVAFVMSVTDLYYSYFPDPNEVFAKTSAANTGLSAELDKRNGDVQRLRDRNASLELQLQRAEIYFRELSVRRWGHFGATSGSFNDIDGDPGPGAGAKGAGGFSFGGGPGGGGGAGGSGGTGAKGGGSKAGGSLGGGGSSGAGSSRAGGIGAGPSGGGDSITEDSTRCRERMRQRGVVLGERDPCVDISEVVKQLAIGTYVFNKPNKAYVGLPFNIALALKTSPEQNVELTISGSPGVITERRARFSQSVEASLSGEDMTVKPEGGQSRTATLVEPVIWEWMVTPKAGGKKTLVLEVAANIQVGPDRHRVQINTLREPIEVAVSNFHRIKTYVADANGFVIAAGATIPALGAIVGLVPPIRSAIVRFWKWLSKRRQPRRH
jgi:hypothetical protein